MTKGNTNKNKQSTANSANLPPKLPGTSEALQRAILLLGNRTKYELGDKSRQELQDLISAYPTSEQAALPFRQAREELITSQVIYRAVPIAKSIDRVNHADWLEIITGS